jgi:diguanylate cyclase (GGDEF)-like protein
MRYVQLIFFFLITSACAELNSAADKQVTELLEMLYMVVNSLGVLSIVLICLLVYFIYDNIKFKNKTVKELEKARKELEASSLKCDITGLLNKKYLDDIFDIEYAISVREKSYLSFFIVEISNFQKLSENRSQTDMDNLLQEVKDVLQIRFKRAADSIFKLDSGVFAAIVIADDKDKVKIHLEKLINEVHHSKSDISISIGLKTNQLGEKLSKESFYKMANHALTEAKKKGRNQLADFDEVI